MEREQVIKALERLVEKCDENCRFYTSAALCDALSLIKELTEEKEKLGFLIDEIVREKRELFEENKGLIEEKNKIFEAGARRLSNLELSYLTLEAENAKLTEENERLREEKVVALRSTIENAKANARADTVQKMQSEIEARCIKGGIYPAFVKSTIDQIAKEIIGGSYGKKD